MSNLPPLPNYFRCDKKIERGQTIEELPDDATIWTSSDNCGSTVYDNDYKNGQCPFLKIYIC